MRRREADPPKRFRTVREARQVARRLVDDGLLASALELSERGDDLALRVYWVVAVEGRAAFVGLEWRVTEYVREDGFIR